jgi:tetratricopeptide (TPR) repeat protein
MMRALLLLSAIIHPGIARAQGPPATAPRNNETAVSDSVTATWIGQYPDRARDSVRAWLARAAPADSEIAADVLARAEQVGTGYARVWGDSSPLLLVRRFTGWPQHNRALWVRADSLRTVGNAALGKEDVTVAIRDWRASIQVARELGDTALVAAAIGNIGAAFYRAIELDSAKRYFAEARRLADLAGDRRTLLNALGGLASVNKDRGQLQVAAAQYTDAIALRRQIGDYRGVAADDNNLGLVAAAVGDDAEARRRHVESLVIAREHGLDEAAAAALVNLGVLSSESGDAVTAEAQYDEALSLYRKLDDPADEALVLHDLGLLESGQGEYPLAVTRFKASLGILRRTGPVDFVAGVRRDLAIVFAAMGNLAEAGRQITAAERLAVRGGLRPATNGRLELVRGDLALDFNRFPTARAAYTAGLALLRRAQDQAGEADALAALGTLDLKEEDNASAREVLARAAARQESIGNRRAAAIARLLGAKAARETGDTAGARTMIATTLDSLQKDGDPVAEAWALCQRGDLERATGSALAAEATYRKGLERLGRRPVPGAAMCLFGGLGETLRARGALGDAISVFEHGVRSIEKTAD